MSCLGMVSVIAYRPPMRLPADPLDELGECLLQEVPAVGEADEFRIRDVMQIDRRIGERHDWIVLAMIDDHLSDTRLC